MTIGERIRLARESAGFSQVMLADRINISKQSLYKYETGVITNIPSDKIEAIAAATHTTPAFLMGWEDKPRRFPILGAVACGEPILMECDFDLYVEKDIKADFVLRAKGDSMKDARILDGDLVFVKSQPTVENGQIAVVAVDDSATLKRFYKYGDLIVLRACNPDFPDIEIKETDNKRVAVLGLAVAFQSLVK